MAKDSAGCLKMARLVAITQIVIGGLLFILGIAELLVEYRFFTAIAGFGIWNGLWVSLCSLSKFPNQNKRPKLK